ncbi:PspC domain-containing protein [Deinococcus pimensis]|uniref:PspC domain-containing protein n=1 Tax=Deinococcus pimensis TaxID=309888 RepID=UPI00047FE99D|nr:PspC domain-containing protein [Deinococcus pimensis]
MDIKLHRSRRNRVLAGVVGGIAGHLGPVSTNVVRVLLVLVSLTPFGFPFFPLAYLAAWALLKEETR